MFTTINPNYHSLPQTISTYYMNTARYNSSSKKYDDTCGATAITQSSSEDSGPSRMLVRKLHSKRDCRHQQYHGYHDNSPAAFHGSEPPRSKAAFPRRNQVKASSKKTHDAPMQKKDMYFAVDCEMVGVGMGGLDSALARVSIINWNNEIVLDTYVKVDQEVTDYRTFVSGIRPEHIESESAISLTEVQMIVTNILKGKILIGHALDNDLNVMGLQHPCCDIRDTAQYAPFMRTITKENDEKISCPRKLKDLVWEKFNKHIQVMGKAHSPVEDSIAAMDLYKSARQEWEIEKMHEVNRAAPQQDTREPMESMHRICSPLAERAGCDAGNQLLFNHQAIHLPAPQQQHMSMPQDGTPVRSQIYNRHQQHHGYHANSPAAFHGSAKSRRKATSTRRNEVKVSSKKTHDAPMQRKDMYFAVDCEMVGVGMGGLDSALARVSIVNWNNEIVLDTYVKVDQEVTDYRTFVSGIRPEHIESESAISLTEVQMIVTNILKGKILIGHALDNDLNVMGLQHPCCDIRDTAQYAPFMKTITKENDEKISCPRKLKNLVWEKFNKHIQVMGKAHSPVEDSIAAMDLYKSARQEWEIEKMHEVNRAAPQQDTREPMDSIHRICSPLAERAGCDAGNQLLFNHQAIHLPAPQQQHMSMPQDGTPDRSQIYSRNQQYHVNSPAAFHGSASPRRKATSTRRNQELSRAKVLAALQQQRMRWQQHQHQLQHLYQQQQQQQQQTLHMLQAFL
jgi:RNA exonuclease 4